MNGLTFGSVVRVDPNGATARPGVFAAGELVLGPLQAALTRRLPGALLKRPRFGPELGAALYAAMALRALAP